MTNQTFLKINYLPRINSTRHKNPVLQILIIAALCSWLSPAYSQSEIPADFAAIIGDNAGETASLNGANRVVGVFGDASFPVLVSADNQAVAAAGRYDNGSLADASRAVIGGHMLFLMTDPTTPETDVTASLFANSVLWAGKQADPGSTVVAASNSDYLSFFENLGYETKLVSTNMEWGALIGCHVFVINFEDTYSPSAWEEINAFVELDRGGIVGAARPWIVDNVPGRIEIVDDFIQGFGLTYSGAGMADRLFEVPSALPSEYTNFFTAVDALIDEEQGGISLNPAEHEIALQTAMDAVNGSMSLPIVQSRYGDFSDAFGWITPTEENPLLKSATPLKFAIALYQSSLLQILSNEDLFVHPAAADFPGQPASDAPRVSRTITIDGDTHSPDQGFIYESRRSTWRMTALYAPPGEIVTVELPEGLANAGLEVQISGIVQPYRNIKELFRVPEVRRLLPLDAQVNEIGYALGGLISILVPPGSSLGEIPIKISGAVETPHFELGVHTQEDWEQTLKHLPGPWGYLKAGNMIIFSTAKRLREVENMQQVAERWKETIDLADELYGYTDLRVREEILSTDRQSTLEKASGIAGYPMVGSWGYTNDGVLEGVMRVGHWGTLHEIGHSYQAHLEQVFTIPSNPEVDVNLMGTMIFNKIYDVHPWDPQASTFFKAQKRLNQRPLWESLPDEERRWNIACITSDDNPYNRMGYDFYFNLSEAFGWEAYQTLFKRLIRFRQEQADPDFDQLTSAGGTLKRDTFYIAFCDAAGHNLDEYFQYYGLGVPGRGYEISDKAKQIIAAKGYPVWNGNRPISSLANPGALTIPEDTPVAAEILASLPAEDPDPGAIFTYTITSGNEDGAFGIDKRSGRLFLQRKLDFESKANYLLTVRCHDNGVPRSESSVSFEISVQDVANEPPQLVDPIRHFNFSQPAGSDLGPLLYLDPFAEIEEADFTGVPEGALSLTSSGQLILEDPAALAGSSYYEVIVTGQDSLGNTFSHPFWLAQVSGLREQIWDGRERYSSQDWSDPPSQDRLVPNATTSDNIGDHYTRRWTGWLIAPQRGNYVFTIAGDDFARLKLSTNEEASNAQTITKLSTSVSFQDFDAALAKGSQSAEIFLEQGKAYWLEVHHAEIAGNDHVAVAWQGPGMLHPEVIDGAYLIPDLSNEDGLLKNQWLNLAGGSWSQAFNWLTSSVPESAPGVSIDFTALDITADATVTLDGNRVAGVLRFGDRDASHSWVIDPGTPVDSALTLAPGPGEEPVIEVMNGTPGTNTTINVEISGQHGLHKKGNGTLVLNGANSYSGRTTINHQTTTPNVEGIVVGHPNALGTGDVLILGQQHFNASLRVNPDIAIANQLTLRRGQGSGKRAILRLDQRASLEGDIIIDSSAASGLAVIVSEASDWQNAPVIAGDFSGIALGSDGTDLYFRGSGHGRITGSLNLPGARIDLIDRTLWELSHPLNRWGELRLLHASAILYAGASNTLAPDGSLFSSQGSTLVLNDAEATSAFDQTVGGLGGDLQIMLDTGSATLTLNTNTDHTHNGTITSAINLVKTGPAMQTLAGSNDFSGDITVLDGTLRFASQAALPTGSRINIDTASGSPLLDPGGFNHSVDELWVNGVRQADGIYHASDSFITGAGTFIVGSISALDSWMLSAGHVKDTSGTSPGESADGSGVANLIQFALGGDPANPADNGIRIISESEAGATSDSLLLTIAVREGAVFSGTPAPSATVDGITYTILGSLNLAKWDELIEEVAPVSIENVDVNPPPGYELRTFRLQTGDSTKGFMRIQVSMD